MELATISSKFQVIIPRKIRDQYHLTPRQKVILITNKNSLRVAIVPPIEDGYGFLAGIDTSVNRDEEDHK